jgi:hypothetical protein
LGLFLSVFIWLSGFADDKSKFEQINEEGRTPINTTRSEKKYNVEKITWKFHDLNVTFIYHRKGANNIKKKVEIYNYNKLTIISNKKTYIQSNLY